MFLLSADSHAAAILSGASPLLLTAVIIIVGGIAGALAHKAKLPALTGQIIAGVMIGGSGLGLLGHEEEKSLLAVTNFAIGLIAVTVGAHLNFRLLHNSLKRILQIAIAESLCAFGCVFAAMQYFNPFDLGEDIQLPAHLLIASLACATSPASALHVIKEKKAKGILVKTMVAVIAMDNLICLAVFEIVRAFAKMQIGEAGVFMTVMPGFLSFIIAAAVGLLVGYSLHTYAHFIQKRYKSSQTKHAINSVQFTIMIISIMMAHGLCEYIALLWKDSGFALQPSPLMANMVEGGLTPILTPLELAELGFQVAIFPASGFLGATEALTRVYRALHDHGASSAADADLHAFGDFNKLMGFDEIIDFEDRFEAP